jgi:hypothetical protein
MKRSKSSLVVLGLAVIVLGGTFYGGMKYGQTSQPSRMGNRPSGLTNLTTANNNFVGGEILSKDDSSITIKLQDGGSKIVFVSDSTQVMKSATGSLADLSVGQQVSANGTSNTDGSISATTVSVRPAGEPSLPAPVTSDDTKK